MENPKQFVYKNPYLLPQEQMAELMKNMAEQEPPKDLREDFDENGLLKYHCEFRVDARAHAADKQKRIESGMEPLPGYDLYEKRWRKKIESQDDIDRQQAVQDKIEKLQISPISKQKLMTFIAFLGRDEKPYSREQFRYLDGNYLTVFLNPAIDAGIIIKTGELKKATYRVNF